MGTHVRQGCRLLRELCTASRFQSRSSSSWNQWNAVFGNVRVGSNSPPMSAAYRLSPLTHILQSEAVSPVQATHRQFSDASPHLAEDDSSTCTISLQQKPSREISDSDENDRQDQIIRETLFDKEFRQLDDMKEELHSSESLDVSGRRRPRRKVKPNLQPSFNFASYVNDSPLLTELIGLGVDLVKWEKGQIPDEVIQMDLTHDLKPILRHMRKIGIKDSDIGSILTRNPYILINGPSEFKEKTNYFLRKKFTPDQLATIAKGAPQLFSRSIEAIDARLGFFQQSYSLTGDQLRDVIVEHPELFRMKLDYVKKVNFRMNKVLRFKPNEIRELFVTVPSIFTMHETTLERRFNQLHDVMLIPHQSLVKFPYLLRVPVIVIKQRHKFLKTVEKAVYDPLEDGYTSLTAFTDYDDENFASKFAGVDYETYRNFLKTL